ncbi:creatininase family protein [Cryptosporangium phraense]
MTTATSTEETERDARVAVLPVGSFEQHGDYLPLITDTLVASVIATAIADRYNLFLLPPVTISCSHEHAGWKGSVSISSRTLAAIVTDVVDSLAHSGVHKLLVVNGHGGNYVLSNVVQEASVGGPKLSLFPSSEDWTRGREDAEMVTSSHADMHAGELETSLLLHAMPEVVRPGYASANHEAESRPHLLSLGMGGYTKSGVIGYPSLGTAEKGAALLESLVRSAAAHLEVLGESPVGR